MTIFSLGPSTSTPISSVNSSWVCEYLGLNVKNDKRGACKQKAATVLPDRTAAT